MSVIRFHVVHGDGAVKLTQALNEWARQLLPGVKIRRTQLAALGRPGADERLYALISYELPDGVPDDGVSAD